MTLDANLTATQVSAYLKRLGINTPSPPLNAVPLNKLHLAHLRAVPFENLDIHLGRPIRLDLPSLYTKIVEGRRGGYCYELNGLFASLLRYLGYTVDLLSARVARPDGSFSEEFDHLALLVNSSTLSGPHLADVGFGDAFLESLPLQDGFTRQQGEKILKLEQSGSAWTYLEDRGEGFAPQYRFTLKPYQLADFAERNGWQQTAPDSHFTQNRICSLATPGGRTSLSGNKLIVTENGIKTQRKLSDTEAREALSERFGVSW